MIQTPVVHGRTVDGETRCVHYGTVLDVVAIRFRCCDRYYPCFSCHAEAETHPVLRWPTDKWQENAILCGVCRTELSIVSYRAAAVCPACGAGFNPGCATHFPLYFEE